MGRTLLVGCSFVQNLQVVKNSEKFLILGSSGSGNQAIATRAIYQCSQEKFEKVIILWSGVNRLDFPVPRGLHAVFPIDKDGNPAYGYYTDLGETIWYHSGGFGASGISSSCPKAVREFFQNQYLGSTVRYLSDLTLLSIIQVQSFLHQQNIPYDMSFIYDVDKTCSDPVIQSCCGNLDRQSPLNSLVDWDRFCKSVTPYEYGKQLDQLTDGFHPTNQCMIDWIKQSFKIDLKV